MEKALNKVGLFLENYVPSIIAYPVAAIAVMTYAAVFWIIYLVMILLLPINRFSSFRKWFDKFYVLKY